MKKALAGIFVVALLVVVAVPVFAAPPRARGAGGPGRGLGMPIAAIPAEVHAAIETATRAAAAKALGITPEVLAQEFAAGKTMVAVAAAKNVPVATVQAAMVTARNAAIDSALQAGKITAGEGGRGQHRGARGGRAGGGGGGGGGGRAGRGPGQGPRW